MKGEENVFFALSATRSVQADSLQIFHDGFQIEAGIRRREGRQPGPACGGWILQICRALHAAHEKSIIHRDMKPDNCFRIKRGGNPDFIKILDFGIAKVISDGSLTGRHDRPKMATEADTLLGTPEYMAPEIARDQKADARVDVYSIGILMYELLTGSVPFKGQTFMASVAMQMVDEPEPPSQRAPEASIPPAIEAVILRALQKDPDDRFPSVRELAESIIEADKTLRFTSQGMPALRFESGDYSSATSITGGLPEGSASGMALLHPGKTIPPGTGAHRALPLVPARTPPAHYSSVRVASTRALGKLGEGKTPVRETLERLLDDGDFRGCAQVFLEICQLVFCIFCFSQRIDHDQSSLFPRCGS